MFNCKRLFKLQIRPQNLILLITTSQDRWIFPSQRWEVRNSIIIIIIIFARFERFPRFPTRNTASSTKVHGMHSYRFENITQPVKNLLLKRKNVYGASNTVIVVVDSMPIPICKSFRFSVDNVVLQNIFKILQSHIRLSACSVNCDTVYSGCAYRNFGVICCLRR